MEPQSPQPPHERPPKRPHRLWSFSKDHPFFKLPLPQAISSANQTCWYLGTFLVMAGLVGFVVPGLFYAHLNPIHNFLFLISGGLAILLGLIKPDHVAQRVCFWMGAFYTLLGLIGFAVGVREPSLTRPTVAGMPVETAFLWKIIPGRFELGTVDHVVHLIVGLIFLASAFYRIGKNHPPENITWH